MSLRINTAFGCAAMAILFAAASSSAQADWIFESSADPLGQGRSASLSFEYDAGADELRLRLTNTATQQATAMTHILQSVFFDVDASFVSAFSGLTTARYTTGHPGWAPLEAIIPDGSSLYFLDGTTDSRTNVSGEWSYANGTIDHSAIGDFGFGAAGHEDENGDLYEFFGKHNIIDPDNESSGNAPNGADFGLIPDAGIDANGNGDDNNDPYIRREVEFVFSDIGGLDGPLAGFNPFLHISDVQFQYGTTFDADHRLTGTNVSGGEGTFIIPAPSAAMAGMAMMFLVAFHTWFSRSRHRLLTQQSQTA